ncbi:DegT/DnrJ/EryC1/StrS family aminotransferase [uncultured Methanobrevibacter sp.]|mgnify:CR=1 FL=1|uniref:DegT/DnrJ/EryC1/StrS family aminotransferase n=1 Tax=uncultured Methanobrevibacter sp. TaxID=253161 RepID=UPI00261F4948|nr:DegT/DnrJ/EryC1/StrS family aminotransferase [uncultured Methanobrevibacter sp.]
MEFKFKEPHKETRCIMAKVAAGENPYLTDTNNSFEKNCQKKIKKLTNHKYSKITNSGNNSIFIALSSIKGSIIIPDQGGWHGFKQIAKFLNKEIITLKTDLGLINTDYLENIDIPKDSALIYTSFAAYTAEQDTASISKFCKDNEITTIEDASAGIGDNEKKLGNGNLSDIIIASTGSPKIINVENGGFISTNNPEVFENTKIPQKLSKVDEITCSGIDKELDFVKNNLKETINATTTLKKHINTTFHTFKRGVNVIIPHEKPKDIMWKLKKELPINHHNFITKCPNYNRLKEKGIVIEVKNLNYESLKKENLDKIIEVINNQL